GSTSTQSLAGHTETAPSADHPSRDELGRTAEDASPRPEPVAVAEQEASIGGGAVHPNRGQLAPPAPPPPGEARALADASVRGRHAAVAPSPAAKRRDVESKSASLGLRADPVKGTRAGPEGTSTSGNRFRRWTPNPFVA